MACRYDRLEHDPRLSEKLSTEDRQRFFQHVTATSIFILSVLLNVFLILLGSFLYWHRGPSNPIFPQALYSPVQNSISYQIKTFDSSFLDDGYSGQPTAEKDEKWKALYRVGNSRISKSEASRLPNKTIAATPGSEEDYLVVISVFHDLHCLDRLRQYLWYFNDEAWNSTYNPFIFERPESFRRDGLNGIVHLDHCINVLRQSSQCFSDITPYVFQWNSKENVVKAHANVVHTCRNFDNVRDWAVERTFIGDWNGTDPRDEQGACRSGDSGACLDTI